MVSDTVGHSYFVTVTTSTDELRMDEFILAASILQHSSVTSLHVPTTLLNIQLSFPFLI